MCGFSALKAAALRHARVGVLVRAYIETRAPDGPGVIHARAALDAPSQAFKDAVADARDGLTLRTCVGKAGIPLDDRV